MFKKIILFCSLFLSLGIEAKELRFSPEDQDLYLATKFLKTAFENKKDNFVVSPLSVYAAAALLTNGAEGESLKELGNIILRLNVPYVNQASQPFISRRKQSVNQALQSYISQKKQFEINNSIWGNDFKPEYQEKMKNELFSEVKPLPHNTSVINEWIQEKTKGRISHLLNEENLEQGGRLFLVNTVYFKDEWETFFDENGTLIDDFHSLDGQLDKVDMMRYEGQIVDYYQDEQMQSVRLPYKNGDAMYIFLPKEGVDFNKFIQDLQAGDLYLKYHKAPVMLRLPKFNLDYKITNMPEFFKKWGIEKVFDPATAELGGLSDKPYYVDKIIHQANIGVNEKGTEASAATVIDMLTAAFFESRLERQDWSIPFIADRPFVFMINNGDFIGVYTKGSSELYAKRLAEEEQARQKAEEARSRGDIIEYVVVVGESSDNF